MSMPSGRVRKVIGGCYEVIRPLGRGGMGKVFLVLDKTSGQKLAMKMLRGQWVDNERVIARFAREVRALRQLNHPSIVKIFDARRDKDTLYYTMEYAEGRSVRDWLKKRGRLGFGSVVRVLALVASALEHAHEITIHRDISPDNIMVMPDGSVKLLDFGLAKLNDANEGLTVIGINMGKIQYNAPEQRRNAADVDHRADIYPLGVMFFEMLTGHRPKVGECLSELRPDLPRECDAFWEKAMAEDREERFPTALAFRLELMELYQLYEARRKGEEPEAEGAGGLRGLLARLNPIVLFLRLLSRKA